jgi:hypothetical protein
LKTAFTNLYTSISTPDKLFGICDFFTQAARGLERDGDLKKIREKRWEIYVVRAVERFEKWWSRIVPCSVGR